jgi:hypothetical protein
MSEVPLNKGAQVFSAAARGYKTSVTAQATYIAREAAKNHFDIFKYGQMILEDGDQISTLVFIATKAHEHLPEERQPIVTIASMFEIVKEVFIFAQKVAYVPLPMMDIILEIIYPEEMAQAKRLQLDDFTAEQHFNTRVQYMIKAHLHMGA